MQSNPKSMNALKRTLEHLRHEKDPGALEADPIVMEVDEENEKMVIVDKKKKDNASEEA